MPRKPTKGYFVRGQFVAEGSELDLQLKAELKFERESSKTELKRESEELQQLGSALIDLRADLFAGLPLSEKLVDALAEARRITNFEGKRRQMQYVGKLMRQLDEDTLAAVREALEVQRKGSAADAQALHEAERWRDALVARDEALQEWLAAWPETDVQQLRALIRQARKDGQASQEQVSKGLAPRHGRAFREIFQLVKQALTHGPDIVAHDDPDSEIHHERE
ncbi:MULTISPECIES: ribosome biogenesis factor YjgA [Ramlibacter]|uniref:Dual-action ribosomal maturation protein DarP n=1 Tax=Ramlibacter aquaticus TaxID=2780094 RepID=A0ABR9S9D7_9BURK|nr:MULTISPECIES: ribosome biogenesis factor YjgA [Ramlibacter]MBE7938964.1 DUF615 domain-containing protein [Ramlibacter aquaticus]